jgi:hypothetical protein
MFATMWANRLKRAFRSKSAEPGRQRRRRSNARPFLERLEDRRLMYAGALDHTFGVVSAVSAAPANGVLLARPKGVSFRVTITCYPYGGKGQEKRIHLSMDNSEQLNLSSATQVNKLLSERSE